MIHHPVERSPQISTSSFHHAARYRFVTGQWGTYNYKAREPVRCGAIT